MNLDTIITLYHSGALFCAGIVAIYLLLKWGTGTIPWLKEPQHAHYATAFLTALAIIAVPASQGTTPNASMLLIAAGTLLSLILPGLLPASPSAKPTPAIAPGGPSAPNGFIRLRLMAILAVVGIFLACGAAQKAAEHTLATCTEDAATKELEPTVESILASGVSNWKAQLTALALAFGSDELDCAVGFVKQLMSTKVAAAPETEAAIARADEWLHRAKS